MRPSTGFFTLGLLLGVGGIAPIAGLAQERGAPLSVIDWLDAPRPLGRPAAPDQIGPSLPEPPVAQTAAPPPIVTRPLDDSQPARVGLVATSVTGMAPDIWAGSDVAQLAELIGDLPAGNLPAANALLFTLLLTEATVAPDMADTLTRARVEKLVELGAVEAALALIEQAGGRDRAGLFDLWADLTLLVGTEDDACGTLSRSAHLNTDIGLDIFCAARGGAWADAALAFGSARALKLLPAETIEVLDRFLNPDLFEEAQPLPVPREITPLAFRLYETIGEPLPTRPLPRAYAVADLRDIAGWKSQLEAAERLARVGALPENRLLGLYSARDAAASGGIWDRVRAVQQLDRALSGSPDAVSRALPPAWQAMQEAGLEHSFAAMVHDRLLGLTLSDEAAAPQARVGLLSPQYEEAARDLPEGVLGARTALLRAVARGEGADRAPDEPLLRAIHDAFAQPAADPEILALARGARLGEALLRTLEQLDRGRRGDSRLLRSALSSLRALGLEDTARRAALQLILSAEET